MPDIIKADGNGAMLYFTAAEMREASEALWRIADGFPQGDTQHQGQTDEPDSDKKYARRLANFFHAASQEASKAIVLEGADI